MSDYVRIASADMYCGRRIDKTPNIGELPQPFVQTESGAIYLAFGIDEWRSDWLLPNLVAYQNYGVRGSVQVIDYYPSWTKYVLSDDGVHCYESDVVYRSEPLRTLKSLDDIADTPTNEAGAERQ